MKSLKINLILALLFFSSSVLANEYEVKKMYLAEAVDRCDEFVTAMYLDGGEAEPQVYDLTINGSGHGIIGQQLLYVYECNAGYNTTSLMYLYDELNDLVTKLLFSEPTYSVSDDGEIKLTGFAGIDFLVNVEFDHNTQTLKSRDLLRGMGDAFSSGHWRFIDGRFSLVYFGVDESFDEEVNPETLIRIKN